mgnify:CR=1 FL=1|jgi:hypothetical protein
MASTLPTSNTTISTIQKNPEMEHWAVEAAKEAVKARAEADVAAKEAGIAKAKADVG